jgi:hypothetical protein
MCRQVKMGESLGVCIQTDTTRWRLEVFKICAQLDDFHDLSVALFLCTVLSLNETREGQGSQSQSSGTAFLKCLSGMATKEIIDAYLWNLVAYFCAYFSIVTDSNYIKFSRYKLKSFAPYPFLQLLTYKIRFFWNI